MSKTIVLKSFESELEYIYTTSIKLSLKNIILWYLLWLDINFQENFCHFQTFFSLVTQITDL